MKDINYFIESERIYNESPAPEMVYIEGIGFDFPYEPLHFLRQKPFETRSADAIKESGEKGLCDVEWLMLHCFVEPFSGYFRSDMYHNGIPAIVIEMQKILDSVIKKAPICKSKTLYRFLNDYDKNDFEIGEVYTPTHSLTTTTEDWGKDTDKYIVTPLSFDKTKAHSLYALYNHGNETQVNFERGTHFIVEDIKYNKNRSIIYLKETDNYE